MERTGIILPCYFLWGSYLLYYLAISLGASTWGVKAGARRCDALSGGERGGSLGRTDTRAVQIRKAGGVSTEANIYTYRPSAMTFLVEEKVPEHV